MLCLLYKGTHVYFITCKIQYNLSVFLTWYQSHYSNFLGLAVLFCRYFPLPQLLWSINPFPQGWISAARSSSSAAKITAFIGSITSDIRLGHKTYHYVAFQSLYTTPPETSSSNHPRATMRRSKFLQNHPRASHAINIAPILSPSPLSELSFFNLHIWKRIGLIRHFTPPHAPPEFHCNVSYAPHALHVPLAAH